MRIIHDDRVWDIANILGSTMLYWRGPNTEKLEPQFRRAMESGGAPTWQLRKEIQPAMEVGVNKLIL